MAWDRETKQVMALDLSKMEEKRKRKFSIKQRKFIKYYLETGNAVKAVMRAYNVRNIANASSHADSIMKTIDFQLLLEMAGVSDKELSVKLTEGLNATKMTKTGQEVPDLELRHKYVVTALEAKKKIKNKLEVTGENGQPIRFNILAGHGFIPSIPRSNEDITASASGTVGRPPEVQDNGLAQKGKKDDNSDH